LENSAIAGKRAAKMMQAPMILQANTKRDSGKKAQHGNIMAAKVRSRRRSSDPSAHITPRLLMLTA
jgi:hypothetical protein